jgi:predicted O-methyltransferase YrrM
VLNTLRGIFEKNNIQINEEGDTIPLHSNTSLKQGLFLQEIFAIVQPTVSLEIGFAYGISALFILEMHSKSKIKDPNRKHLAIEPDDYWGGAAMYNIRKEGLEDFLDLRRYYSDQILPKLFFEGIRIQYAYVDTTKRFDIVLHDFYFINKILDVGGVIILDDTGGVWPGVQRVARYVSTLPNYAILKGHNKVSSPTINKFSKRILATMYRNLPFAKRLFYTHNMKTDAEMGVDYYCIAFIKVSDHEPDWSWDKPF